MKGHIVSHLLLTCFQIGNVVRARNHFGGENYSRTEFFDDNSPLKALNIRKMYSPTYFDRFPKKDMINVTFFNE